MSQLLHGTPGYVDPEYYQCYQLNDKSDVYSFGVVLIELISSKPAVDISRHRHEINLANMAINRIQQRALHELVDPNLGYETDYEVRNMITLVAELAFRCLQQEKDMRPCMTEVLEILSGIASDTKNKIDDMDTSAAARLLKHSQPLSTDAVTDKWPSRTSTPNTSG
ncbi:non-specific serine/threonine protein kinase [Ranunculus cassubicifolius]